MAKSKMKKKVKPAKAPRVAKAAKKSTPGKKSSPLKSSGKKKAKTKVIPKLAARKKTTTQKLSSSSEKKPSASKPSSSFEKKSSASSNSKNPQKSASIEKSKKDWAQFVTPLDDRLLVKLEETSRRTPGGLYIPDNADISGNHQGFVVAVGRGHRDKKGRVRPMDVQVGDQVVFSQYAGNKVQMLNEEVVILRESDILGILS